MYVYVTMPCCHGYGGLVETCSKVADLISRDVGRQS